jgi:hypothetical protein
LGALGEEARIFIFLLALASLKELSEINKPLVLEHLLEGLVFRKEECCLSYWSTKIFQGNISVSVSSCYSICRGAELCLLPVPVILLCKEEKIGEEGSFVFPGLRKVAHTSDQLLLIVLIVSSFFRVVPGGFNFTTVSRHMSYGKDKLTYIRIHVLVQGSNVLFFLIGVGLSLDMGVPFLFCLASAEVS